MIDIYTHHEKLNWTEACELPVKLNSDKHLGFDDWVLPTVSQAYFLCASGLGKSLTVGEAWSSSSSLTVPGFASFVCFKHGTVDIKHASNTSDVPLVRASQLAEIGRIALEKIGMATPTVPTVKYEHPHADLAFQWADLVARGEVDKGWWEVHDTYSTNSITIKTLAPYWNVAKTYKIVKTNEHTDNAKVELTISVPVSYLEAIAGQSLPRISPLTSASQDVMEQISQQARLKLLEGAK